MYKEIQMGSGAKSKIYEEGLPTIWGNAQIFSPYMRMSLVIYDFAPDPSEFPNIWGNLFYQCVVKLKSSSRIIASLDSSISLLNHDSYPTLPLTKFPPMLHILRFLQQFLFVDNLGFKIWTYEYSDSFLSDLQLWFLQGFTSINLT